MDAVRISQVIEKDGEVRVKGLPFKKGQRVEIIVLEAPTGYENVKGIPAKELLESGLIEMWADRDDIPDSPEFARQLREQPQRRWRSDRDDE